MHDSILGFPSTSGIYKITSPTGKVYVGEAVNLRIRCSYYLTPNRVKKQRAAEFVGVGASNIRECKKSKNKAKRIYLVEDYEICTN